MGGVDDDAQRIAALDHLDAVVAEARVDAFGATDADMVHPVVGEHQRAQAAGMGPVDGVKIHRQAVGRLAVAVDRQHPVGLGLADLRQGGGEPHPGLLQDPVVTALLGLRADGGDRHADRDRRQTRLPPPVAHHLGLARKRQVERGVQSRAVAFPERGLALQCTVQRAGRQVIEDRRAAGHLEQHVDDLAGLVQATRAIFLGRRKAEVEGARGGPGDCFNV